MGKILVVAGNGEEDANGDDDKESKLGDLEESSCGTQGRHPCLVGDRCRPEIWKSRWPAKGLVPGTDTLSV